MTNREKILEKWKSMDFLKDLKLLVDDTMTELFESKGPYKVDDEWDITNIHNCDTNLNWDYNGVDLSDPKNPYSQIDWNHTLITKFNHLSAHIYQKSMRGGATHLIMHPHLKPLLKTIEYFDEKNSKLLRFDVIFDYDLDIDIIYVVNKKLIDSKVIKVNDDTFLDTKDCTKEEIREYRKKICAYLRVLNYD